MYKANSGRSGMSFTYNLPGTTPTAPTPKPLTFRTPVRTYAPVTYPSITESKCKYEAETVLKHQVIGGASGGVVGLVGGPPGAGVGVLTGVVAGTVTGALEAGYDVYKCKKAEVTVAKLNARKM